MDTFRDFQRDLPTLLVDGSWISARLIDTGRTAGGRRITLQEFARYRIERGRGAAAWGNLDPQRILA